MSPRVFEAQRVPRKIATLKTVDGRTYPLRAATIRARAEGGLAATTLIQEYANPYEEPLEVIYTLPLPADGAVLGYTVHVGDRVIRGEVQPREKAEEAYRHALYEGRTTGLLEQDRDDTFQQRLGNIPPRTDARIEIEILQPLAFLAGIGGDAPSWEYRFPTVASVRYQGEPGRVPDSERLDVDRDGDGGIPARVALDLTIADETARGGQPSSASHGLTCETKEGGVHVRLAEASRLDRDLAIRWAASVQDVGVRVVEGGGLPGDDGRYALLTITPPEAPKAFYRRDLTVLLDTSGSMDGEPLRLAKRVVVRLLESLGEGDRFEVLAFANETVRVTRGLVEASPRQVRDSVARVEKLGAGGGTEMSKAMGEALRPLRKDAQRQILLVTDGQIGFEREVIAKLTAEGHAVARVHVVGVGSAANRALTHGVARAGRGVELHASDDSTADEAVARLIAGSASPVLVDLTVGGSAVQAAAPRRPRDVFAGQPLVMTAELKPSGGMLGVTAILAGSREQWIWRMETPAAASSATPLPLGAHHGREIIADLESGEVLKEDALSYLIGRGSGGAEREIERVAMRHKIVSRRTSLVAIAEEPSVDPLAPRRRERLAVELPAGVSAEGVGLKRFLGGPDIRYRLSMGVPPTAQMRSISRLQMREAEAPSFMRRADTGSDQHHVTATALHIDGLDAVIEFEVPVDEFYLPTGDLMFLVIGSQMGKARVIEEKSAARGPHAGGLLVRLALRLEKGLEWPAGEEVELHWKDLDDREFILTVSISPEADQAP